MDAAMFTDLLDPDTEALMFAIYYSAITSPTGNQCGEYVQKSQASLLENHGSAWENAFQWSKLPDAWSIVAFQGATLFGACLRDSGNSTFEYILVSILIHATQKAGLHQDESCFTRSTLNTKIRRRL